MTFTWLDRHGRAPSKDSPPAALVSLVRRAPLTWHWEVHAARVVRSRGRDICAVSYIIAAGDGISGLQVRRAALRRLRSHFLQES